MVKNSQRQIGSALITIVILLGVILIGVLGFVVWNIFLKPTENLITYNPPITFSLSTNSLNTQTKLVGAPASFKSYILSVFYDENGTLPGSCNRTITIKQIYEQKFATATETLGGAPNCSGGELGIYGIVDGSWKGLASTDRSAFICSDLEQYKIPSIIAGTKCLNPQSDSTNGTDYTFTTVVYSQK